jgi:hypothetical protein
MEKCKSCRRLGISIARFGWGTIIFFLGVTMLMAWQGFRSQLWWWVLPSVPWVAWFLAAMIFTWSGLCILTAWMRKHAFAKVGVVFLVAAIATLFHGGVLMTIVGWGVRQLFLLGFLCFGLAVNSPRHANLLWTSFRMCKDEKRKKGSCESGK